MSDAYSRILGVIDSSSQATANIFWDESDAKQSKNAFRLSRMTTVAALAFALSFAPSTVVADPWLMEKRQRDAVVTMSVYKEIIGRLITRSEALMIADQILEQAEKERLAIAEIEAANGIQWG